jgi:hypothetical protein
MAFLRTMTAKHSADIEAVEKEHAGYVPTDAADEIDIEGKHTTSHQILTTNTYLSRCSPGTLCRSRFDRNGRRPGRRSKW